MASKPKYWYKISLLCLLPPSSDLILSYFVWHNRYYIYLSTQLREAESSRYRYIHIILRLLLHALCCYLEFCVAGCKSFQEVIVTVWIGELLKQIL